MKIPDDMIERVKTLTALHAACDAAERKEAMRDTRTKDNRLRWATYESLIGAVIASVALGFAASSWWGLVLFGVLWYTHSILIIFAEKD